MCVDVKKLEPVAETRAGPAAPPRTPAPCLLRPSPAAPRTSGTTLEAGRTLRHPRRPAGGLPPGVSTGSTPEAARERGSARRRAGVPLAPGAGDTKGATAGRVHCGARGPVR